LDFVASVNAKKLQESYLGFVIVKPIENSNGEPVIGRSILKPYSPQVGAEKRFFVKGKNYVSFFGLPFVIESLPFQMQDQRVGGCATITLWSALHPLCDTFGTLRHSPAEITELATLFPSEFRAFPSSGLNLPQMINYVRSIGLDIEVIKNVEVAHTAVKGYIKEAKLPLIAALILEGKADRGLHAVVISGYRCDSEGEVKELYVHDDQIGPYSRVKPNGNFKVWGNEWNDRGYEVILEKLLVPIYPKIRLTFARINRYYIKMKERIKARRPDLNLELYLTSIQEYKKFLLQNRIKDKTKVLTMSLPRFVWIIRAHKDPNQPLWDKIYDGTSTFVRVYRREDLLPTIEYET